MITPTQGAPREKVNFMVNRNILIDLKKWIPAGERSNFVNGALEKAILRFKREKAFVAMDELREKAKLRMTDAEIIRFKNYGRK